MFQEFLIEQKLEELLCAPGKFHPFPTIDERTEWDKLSDDIKERLLKQGETAFDGYPQLTASQYMAYSRTGDRQIMETPYFERRKRLFGAVLAECIENQGRFLDAIIDGLWLICEETTWVVSAHNNADPDDMYPFSWNMLPDETNQPIDLFAAQTSAVLSYVLYLMGGKLDAVTPQVSQRVKREIDRRILIPFLTRNDFWWMGYGSKTVNNWNTWILSNIIDTVLIVEADAARRNQMIRRAMIMLDHYIAVMPEDGGCDEGAGYFNVAGASLLDCLESLYCASSGKISFYEQPHIAAIGSYPEKAYIGADYYLNFADCDARPFVDGERLYTYGKRTGNQRLMDLGTDAFHKIADRGEHVIIRDTPQINRTLFSLFQAPERREVQMEPLPYMQLPDLQVFSWYEAGIYAAIKGGHNDESHNHNDVGSFVIYADGEPEIIDMGNKVYTAATFGPNRYQINNTRSMNHNVPLIGNTEQSAGREYAARNIVADSRGIQMDIRAAYPVEAGLESLNRSLRHDRNTVTLTDSIKIKETRDVTWTFMLRNRPHVENDEIYFGKLKMKFDTQLAVKVEEIPVDDARMQRSFPGSLWRLTLKSNPNTMHDQTFVITRA